MLGHFFNYYYLNNMKTIRMSNHETIFYLQQNIDNKCLNLKIVKFYAQKELISNVMPATHLKIVGTGACLPWCNISSSLQNSLKMSGYWGYEFLEFLCSNLVHSCLIGFLLLKSLLSSLMYFALMMCQMFSIGKRSGLETGPDSSTTKPCCRNSCSMWFCIVQLKYTRPSMK